MALFTIAEPGQSKPRAPARRKRAVGIDLGTTNSLVAVAKEGQAETLPDTQGAHLLPSVVHYRADGSISVGAQDAAGTEALSVASIKRLMGRGLDDVDYRLAYGLGPAPEGGMPLV